MTSASGEPSERASGVRELLIEVDRTRGRLQGSLRESLRAAIQDGRLAAGTRLPSSRRLASDLGVSRGVVSDAYDQLVAEGYLLVRPRTAPVVAEVPGVRPVAPEPIGPTWTYDFTATRPDVSLFPRRAFARAADRVLRQAPDAAWDYGDPRGRIELRAAASEYLARVRGVRVDPGRLVVVQGFTQAVDLLCRALVRQGATTMAVESPSLVDISHTIAGSGLRRVGVPVDPEGVRADLLAATDADAVVVSPAHQFPTGAVLAPARRSALVAWARERRALVVEDDYDAEFRYDRTPVGAVQGLAPDRVAHVGTVSKTLAPGVRLAWISLPEHLVESVIELKGLTDAGSPALDQLVLADLLGSGAYERHVNRTRQIYRRRRDRLVGVLAEHGITAHGVAAGLHVVVPVDDAKLTDTEIAEAAATRGIRVEPLSRLYVGAGAVVSERAAHGLVLGYGRLREERIGPAVRALLAVLGGSWIARGVTSPV